MDAHLIATLDVLEELLDGMSELLGQIDEPCANWRPPEPGANPIAVLARHIDGSLTHWLSRAADQPFERDRDAEFEAMHSPSELVEVVAGARQRARERFAQLQGVDPAAERGLHDEEPVTVAWCLAHAVIHAGEHWGHIQAARDRFVSAMS